MSLHAALHSGAPAVVAILRGVRPDEVLAIARALFDAGVRIIETPLNSPQPLASIERLAVDMGERALIGAGTVTSVEAVDAAAAAGARLIVAPNVDAAVIGRARERGLDVMPGALTPTEIFGALAAGARDVKLFPCAAMGLAHLQALREVLPADCSLWAVGGVNAANLGDWLRAGASGAGIGGALYRPGASPQAVRKQAEDLIAAWRTAQIARACAHS